jgi:hypothetical protein
MGQDRRADKRELKVKSKPRMRRERQRDRVYIEQDCMEDADVSQTDES